MGEIIDMHTGQTFEGEEDLEERRSKEILRKKLYLPRTRRFTMKIEDTISWILGHEEKNFGPTQPREHSKIVRSLRIHVYRRKRKVKRKKIQKDIEVEEGLRDTLSRWLGW